MISYSFLVSEEINKDDVFAINALLDILSSNPPELTKEDVRRVVRSCATCVARNTDHAIIGMASLLRLRKCMSYMGSIEDVVVASSFQGQGVARRMIEMLHDVARTEGMEMIDLTSNPSRVEARRLYESLGYEPRDTCVFRKYL